MKLIVGLGNPGRSYTHNRHNIGFRCLNYFAKLHSISFRRQQCRAKVGAGKVAGNVLLLAKPVTFVNFSGKAIGSLVQQLNLSLGDLIVIHDDLDLPLGKIRLRPSGGSGGHKGIKSIISALESEDFPRVRVGIGRPLVEEQSNNGDNIVNYVLSDFSPQEEAVIESAIIKVGEAIECFLTQGIEAAMSRFN